MTGPEIQLTQTQLEEYNHAKQLMDNGNGKGVYDYLHGITNATDRNQVLRKFKEIDQKRFGTEDGTTQDDSVKMGQPHLAIVDNGTDVTSLKAVKSGTNILTSTVEEVIY